MLQILTAIKTTIERFILQTQALTLPAMKGATSINVESARRFSKGDYIIVESSDDSTSGEIACIADKPDNQTLVLSDPLQASYEATTGRIKKAIGWEGCDPTAPTIYLGEPDVIDDFPAITISADSRDFEWLTIGTVSYNYAIDITVFAERKDREAGYKQMLHYVQAIESGLFRTLYPLVEPYHQATISEPIEAGDVTVQTTDVSQSLCGSWVFLESVDALIPNRIRQYHGNGIYELVNPVAIDFDEDSKLIAPGRHVYSTMPAATDYATANDGTIHVATIRYHARE